MHKRPLRIVAQALLSVLAITVELSAQAGPTEEHFKTGVAQIEAGDFLIGLMTLNEVVAPASNADLRTVARAHVYRAQANLGLRQPLRARTAALLALKADASVIVTAPQFSAAVVTLFDELRRPGGVDWEATGLAAEKSGRYYEAFTAYLNAFQALPDPAPAGDDHRLRERIIEVVARLETRPAIPQEASDHLAKATQLLEAEALFGGAGTASSAAAAAELRQAIRFAPWWPDATFKLAGLLQKLQRLDEALSLYYAATSSFRVRASYRESRAGSSNVGVGGITLQEAGFATWFLTRDSRTTATRTWSRLAYEGGIAINQTDSTTQANATSPGISVGGDVVMGGASIADSRRTTTRWNSRHLVRAGSARSWTAGIALAGSGEMRLQTPNPAGTFYFADVGAYRSSLAGGKTGTWSVTRGGKPIRFGTLTASPFAHTELVRARNVTLNGGLRADYQSGFGIIVSPRVSLSTEWRAFVLHAGAGMFVQSLPESIFISAMETDGRYLEQIAPEVSLRDPADGLLRSAAAVQSRIASGLTRPRTLMWRLSAERALHGVRTALDDSVADDRRLSGSERRLADSGWVDVFESNRSATRRRVHANARRTWDRRQLAIDYEYTFARDNTDGPFSFPEEPGNLAAEWAPSSGVPPHNFTVMTMLELPAAISVNMVDVWRSGAPFNITTALDSHGNGLVVDRGGRARNSGDGPRFHSLSLYVHRRVEWPDFLKVPQESGVHLSVQVDNILNTRNYFAVGSIAGSTTFGMPLAAYPGRSIRVMFSVD